MTHRRTLLALAVPALFAGGTARAFREQPATAADTAAWRTACRPLLPIAGGLRADDGAQMAICPYCGCPVVGAADHGEGAAPPPL